MDKSKWTEGKRKTRWLRIALLSFFGLFVIILLVAAYSLTHPETLKPLAAYLVERRTGRVLEIEGPVQLSVSSQPEIIAQRVRLSNPNRFGAVDTISADYVRTRIDLTSLFDEQIELLDLVAETVEVQLADPSEGPRSTRLRKRPRRFRWVVRQFDFKSSLVHVPRSDSPPLNIQVTELAGGMDQKQHVSVRGRGSLNEYPLQVLGTIGTLDALIARTNVEMDLDLLLGETKIAMAGKVTDLASLGGTELTFRATGPDSRVYGELFGMADAFEGDVSLQADLRSAGTGLGIKADGHVGAFEVTLDATADDPRSLSKVAGEFALSGPEIRLVGKALGLPQIPSGAFKIAGHVSRDGARLVLSGVRAAGPNAELELDADFPQFPDIQNGTAKLHFWGTDISPYKDLLRVPELPAKSFDLEVRLESARQQIAANLKVGDHALSAEGTLGDDPGFEGTELMVQSSGGELSEVTRVAGFGSAIRGRYTAAGTVSVVQGEIRADAATLATGLFTYSGNMLFRNLDDVPGLSTDGELDVPSLQKAAGLFGYEDLPDKPVKATFRLQMEQGTLRIDSATIRGDDLLMEVEGRLALTESFVGTDMRVSAQGPNLSDILPALGPYRPPAMPFRLEGRVAVVGDSLVEFDKLELAMGGARLQASGRVDPTDRSRADLTLSAEGDHLSDLGSLRYVVLRDSPFKVEAVLRGNLREVDVLRLDLTIGDSHLEGDGSVDLAGARPTITFRGSSRGLSEVDLLKAATEPAEEKTKGDKLFPDTPLPVALLDRANVNLELDVQNYKGLAGNTRDIRLRAALTDGVLDVQNLDYESGYGKMNVSGSVRRSGDSVHVTLTEHGENLDLRIFTAPDQADDTIPLTTIDLKLTGEGNSVAAIAASLNGSVLVSSTGGKFDNKRIELLGGDFFLSVIDAVNPFVRKERHTKLECAVLSVRIADGIVTLEPGVVISTDKLNTFVLGHADLGAESLHLSLVSHPRKGVGVSPGTIVNPYFNIGGTFARPRLQFDADNAAKSYGAAVVTGGISILAKGLLNRLKGEADPCREFLEAAQ